MSEWWTYTFSDFLLYSARTWFRLIEQYNTALWPVHLVAMVLGLGIIVWVMRPPAWQGPAVAGTLALLWAWVAIAYLWRRYATINWAATWFAAAFVIEALGLAWAGPVRKYLTFRMRRGARGWVGLTLLLFAVLAYPLIVLLAGRGIAQGEAFGMMPDPTALGTIGVLLLAEGRWRRRLMAIPLLWCLLSGAMLWALSRESTAVQPRGPGARQLVVGPETAFGGATQKR